jgi:hypothetical protein
MGVAFWVDYEWLKPLCGCDGGAAWRVGSLDNCFKTQSWAFQFVLVIVLIYFALLVCPGKIGELP